MRSQGKKSWGPRAYKKPAAKAESEAPSQNVAGGRVTALEPQAKRQNRYNLYLDDHFALGLSEFVAAQVRVGQELTAEEVAHLAEEEAFERARERALGLLDVRPRSESEIRRKLSSTYSQPILDRVIARLRETGLLGDGEFAQFWVENREGFKPRSARALKYELRQKGVPDETIKAAVSNLDERDSAYRAARAKAERYRDLDLREFQAKVGGFLARRGFDYAVTREIMTRLYRELHAPADADSESEEAGDGPSET